MKKIIYKPDGGKLVATTKAPKEVREQMLKDGQLKVMAAKFKSIGSGRNGESMKPELLARHKRAAELA